MTKKQIIVNWVLKSEKDIHTAKDLFKWKHYDWSLFVWHLILEKILKAKIVQLGKTIIFSHDLTRLAKQAEISLTSETVAQLNEVTTFNIEARYDDYKLSFYKKATKSYAQKWSKICENFYNLVKKTI